MLVMLLQYKHCKQKNSLQQNRKIYTIYQAAQLIFYPNRPREGIAVILIGGGSFDTWGGYGSCS